MKNHTDPVLVGEHGLFGRFCTCKSNTLSAVVDETLISSGIRPCAVSTERRAAYRIADTRPDDYNAVLSLEAHEIDKENTTSRKAVYKRATVWQAAIEDKRFIIPSRRKKANHELQDSQIAI